MLVYTTYKFVRTPGLNCEGLCSQFCPFFIVNVTD